MCASHEVDELASKSEGRETKSKVCSRTSFYLGCHCKVPPTFRIGLPISKQDQKENKKSHTGMPSDLPISWLITDPTKLAAKI